MFQYVTPHSVCSHVVPIYFHQWPAGCSANPADGHDTCPKGRARNHYDIVGSAGSSNCTTRSRCLQSQDQTIQPGPKATNGPTRELVHYARSHCRRTGANSGFFPILVLSQVRNALLGTRFQSPPTQSHDRPCHHRSNSGKDSKSLLRVHCPQETGVRNLGSMPPTRNIETDETSEDESRHAPPTDNEAQQTRGMFCTTGLRNVPDTAAVSLTSEQTKFELGSAPIRTEFAN